MTVIRLASLSDERLDVYARLTNHQLRNRLEPERGVLIAESPYAIGVALDAGVRPLSMLVEDARLDAVSGLVSRLPEDVPVFVLPAAEMRSLTGYNANRGPLCAMRRPRPRDAREVVAGARRVAVLEGLTDVSNVGAVFRSAAGLGVDAVLVAPTCADPCARRAVRVSMGTVFQVPWAFASGPWPEGTLSLLHGEGFYLCALALEEGALRLDDPSLASRERLALFFGTEGTGLTRPVLEGCDASVVIPMSHGVDSLNVAASSAVAFWELCARRGVGA